MSAPAPNFDVGGAPDRLQLTPYPGGLIVPFDYAILQNLTPEERQEVEREVRTVEREEMEREDKRRREKAEMDQLASQLDSAAEGWMEKKARIKAAILAERRAARKGGAK
jgi:hypothetical protein